MEFRTYILRIFIHSLVNSKSNELPQSLGGLWCFLLLLSSPFLFFLGFKVIFKIFKLCGMAKQTNKQTNKKNGVLAFSWFQTHLTILTCLLFFLQLHLLFCPTISIDLLACLIDSYSFRAKNALNSCMWCNFVILKKYGRRIAPDLIGITREVHKRWEGTHDFFLVTLVLFVSNYNLQ